MIINHLENGVTEYITEKAIVRVHPGKSEEEQRAVFEMIAQRFFKYFEEMKKGQAV